MKLFSKHWVDSQNCRIFFVVVWFNIALRCHPRVQKAQIPCLFSAMPIYTMFIQIHYTNCSIKTLNVIEEPSKKTASKNSPPPFNLITLAFTGPISALKLLTKLLLIPEWESECLGFHCSGWSGCDGLPLIRRNQISLCLMHRPFVWAIWRPPQRWF